MNHFGRICLFVIAYIFYAILYKTNLVFNNTIVEGFSYNECRGQGYSKEFCVQTPISVFGPNVCQCDDGRIGQILPGFRGECICNNINYI
jgi:hypothetical protein